MNFLTRWFASRKFKHEPQTNVDSRRKAQGEADRVQESINHIVYSRLNALEAELDELKRRAK